MSTRDSTFLVSPRRKLWDMPSDTRSVQVEELLKMVAAVIDVDERGMKNTKAEVGVTPDSSKAPASGDADQSEGANAAQNQGEDLDSAQVFDQNGKGMTTSGDESKRKSTYVGRRKSVDARGRRKSVDRERRKSTGNFVGSSVEQ